jgi:hypothetical protein
MQKGNWWIIGIVVIVILLLSFGGGMMSSGGWGYRGGGMMGGYGGMMGGWGYSPLGWFGMGLGMLFMWIVPIGVLALIVFGAVSLTRNNGNSTPSSSSQPPCPNCTKGVQPDWSNCPYCGTALK